jgi:hypothetical protein
MGDGIKKMIAGMIHSYSSMAAQSETSLHGKLELYAAAVASFPEWAIGDACRRFIEGRAGDSRYVPSAAQLAQECRDIVQPHHEEHVKIARILTANVYHVPAPEERERVADGFSKLLAEIGGTKVVSRPKVRTLNPEDTRAEFAATAAKSTLFKRPAPEPEPEPEPPMATDDGLPEERDVER